MEYSRCIRLTTVLGHVIEGVLIAVLDGVTGPRDCAGQRCIWSIELAMRLANRSVSLPRHQSTANGSRSAKSAGNMAVISSHLESPDYWCGAQGRRPRRPALLWCYRTSPARLVQDPPHHTPHRLGAVVGDTEALGGVRARRVTDEVAVAGLYPLNAVKGELVAQLQAETLRIDSDRLRLLGDPLRHPADVGNRHQVHDAVGQLAGELDGFVGGA